MTDRIVAAFDFDGTITTSDSFRHFVRYAVGTRRFAWAGLRALPWIVAMKAGLMSRGDAKAKFAWFALGPAGEAALDALARSFVADYLPQLVRADMLERVREHRARGHEVVLVSASPSLYLEKWAKTAGIDTVLATRLAFERGRFTGRLAGENCWGPQKVVRLRGWWGNRPPATLFAYGDSRGDKEMAELANHAWIRGQGPLPPIAG
ncbi:HAD family hydrolase [Burkholderia vietnamiensis]|uniref:HAD family hydrolase n=1 Tax=Burkholderia vietnamiensis TaxID=60552 RepID=UPI00075C1BA7|nr:HAD family hydrolase [Burkholderia vietnamiensis]KVF68722.1 HAD family hydrolase [Burkholderia vietnamiensis]KVF75670.1 HAD family hydrolase [Burkholderia vietnamiensis]KVF86739.1 HAD family hydrolase [Burkholderia vietnamiensis]KVF87843.1 HAD family hydrolase [Burkholderia vietnamiensis]KVF99228.1 HAD family hydrolase [Burkholderia vietnamiensis]